MTLHTLIFLSGVSGRSIPLEPPTAPSRAEPLQLKASGPPPRRIMPAGAHHLGSEKERGDLPPPLPGSSACHGAFADNPIENSPRCLAVKPPPVSHSLLPQTVFESRKVWKNTHSPQPSPRAHHRGRRGRSLGEQACRASSPGPMVHRLQLNQNGLFLMVFYTDKWAIILGPRAVRELRQILR